MTARHLADLNKSAMIAARMWFEEIAPAPDIADFVECFWRFTFDAATGNGFHTVVPDGLVNLVVVEFAGQIVVTNIVGPSTKAYSVPLIAGTRTAGMRLWPGAAQALLGLDVLAQVDRISSFVSATDLDEAAVGTLLLGTFTDDPFLALNADMRMLLRDRELRRPAITAIARHIASQPKGRSVESLAAEAGLSSRHFRDLFKEEAGIGPKTFAIVRRRRAAWSLYVEDKAHSLSDASFGAGYADQAHLTRDTRVGFNASPTRVGDYLTRIRHRFITR